MNCENCYKLSTQINDEGEKNYCLKKGITLQDDYYIQEHPDCCVCDGRRDSHF